jgi:hypothetical protein
MMLSLIYGVAIRDSVDAENDDISRIRVYVGTDTDTYVGTDTTDIAHVCDDECGRRVVGRGFKPSEMLGDNPAIRSFVRPLGDRALTIDVIDFDPGDDPYIKCAACDATLLRDDAAFLEQHGRPIND